jgi:hypothetical protein
VRRPGRGTSPTGEVDEREVGDGERKKWRHNRWSFIDDQPWAATPPPWGTAGGSPWGMADDDEGAADPVGR